MCKVCPQIAYPLVSLGASSLAAPETPPHPVFGLESFKKQREGANCCTVATQTAEMLHMVRSWLAQGMASIPLSHLQATESQRTKPFQKSYPEGNWNLHWVPQQEQAISSPSLPHLPTLGLCFHIYLKFLHAHPRNSFVIQSQFLFLGCHVPPCWISGFQEEVWGR